MKKTGVSAMLIWLLGMAMLAGGLGAITGELALAQELSPALACAALNKLALPQTTITAAQVVGAGEFVVPAPARPPMAPAPASGPATQHEGAFAAHPEEKNHEAAQLGAFCRVAATLRPSNDSQIRIEVWLPLEGWNGDFAAAGNGGWAGSLPYAGMVTEMLGHYAVAGTDTGHDAAQPGQSGGAFLIGHPEKMIDYAYRADHEMTIKAKDLVAAFYGRASRHSYWVGCSLGGEEALMEAYRYPEDYDGIVAGAPVNPLSRLNAAQLWPAWLNYKHPEQAIPAEKFVMIHQAVLKACATPIGQKQGFVEDPEHCNFDPAALACKSGDAGDCLTPPQIQLLRSYYAGPVNPRTGQSIFPGMPYGGEMQWAADKGGAKPIFVAVDLYKYAVFQNPAWDWKTIDYDKDIDEAVRVVDPLLYARPELNGFLERGGKLMLYVGWAEYHNANDLRDYYHAVLQNAGADEQNSVRLFEVPGMGHCAGGAGCDTFDKLSVIAQWVESGKAPERIVAAKMAEGRVVRTRPLCAYPKVARYQGAGSEDAAESYLCSER